MSDTTPPMDMRTAVNTVFGKFATFTGRARRSEFWWWVLFVFIASAVLELVDGLLFGFGPGEGQPLAGLFSLVVLIPNLAVGARRLHDTNRSAWWLLLGLIPLIGALILIWWFAQPGDEGENRFGPDPTRAALGTGTSSVPRTEG